MSAAIESIVERLQYGANVESAFGKPIEREGRTVVPVARVSYGFGGGFGRGGGPDGPESDAGGGGGGGGASATPVGALDITDEGVEFVRVGSRRRSVVALLAGVAVGLVVGRRWRS